MSSSWNVTNSRMSQNTSNPIRKIVDQMKITPNPSYELIPLSIGDPTLFGNLNPPESAVNGVIEAIKSGKNNGYVASIGSEDARKAIAKYMSTDNHILTSQDILLCSGASSAIDICISALANPGDNILIPRPGFSLYRTLADSLDIECRYYDLLPHQDWQIDLTSIERLTDDRTRFIVINNPSNPCGSVFSREHQVEILQLLEKLHLPLLADEIYHEFVFEGTQSYLFSSLTDEVPILSCSSLAKRFMVPGWRLGWIAVYDKRGHFQRVRQGLLALTTRILGPNTLIQAAVPAIMENTNPEYFRSCIEQVERNAKLTYKKLSTLPGLTPIMPRGAMYMMVGIRMEMFPEFKDDLQFTEALVSEFSVFCLPAKCFAYPNYIRLVLTVPKEQMEKAVDRMERFCTKHCCQK